MKTQEGEYKNLTCTLIHESNTENLIQSNHSLINTSKQKLYIYTICNKISALHKAVNKQDDSFKTVTMLETSHAHKGYS